jgi:hypothetical protein
MDMKAGLSSAFVMYSASKEVVMSKSVSIALLVVGVVLIVYGANAAQSIGSDFSRMFTGAPTDKAIWLLAGGIIAAIVGFFGILRGRPG